LTTPSLHVALVDDQEDNRLLFSMLLEMRYKVTAYASGRAALDGFATVLPDIVLLDISLPDMDGTEVLRQIRADERLRRLPVIALTAHSSAGDSERFLDGGFDGYIAKPLEDDEILYTTIEGVAVRSAPPAPPAGG
jgi:CheY-like chemotaxis protein